MQYAATRALPRRRAAALLERTRKKGRGCARCPIRRRRPNKNESVQPAGQQGERCLRAARRSALGGRRRHAEAADGLMRCRRADRQMPVVVVVVVVIVGCRSRPLQAVDADNDCGCRRCRCCDDGGGGSGGGGERSNAIIRTTARGQAERRASAAALPMRPFAHSAFPVDRRVCRHSPYPRVLCIREPRYVRRLRARSVDDGDGALDERVCSLDSGRRQASVTPVELSALAAAAAAAAAVVAAAAAAAARSRSCTLGTKKRAHVIFILTQRQLRGANMSVVSFA